MKNPNEVQMFYKSVELENLYFRTWLKNHVDSKELDIKMHALHQELLVPYDCLSCRNCCKNAPPLFSEKDILKSSHHLQMDPSTFKTTYTIINEGEIVGKEIPCQFLNNENKCILEPNQPLSCQLFPYTSQNNRLSSLYGTLWIASICPPVCEMIERLKKHYHFTIEHHQMDTTK